MEPADELSLLSTARSTSCFLIESLSSTLGANNIGQQTARPVSTMGHRLSRRQLLSLFVFVGLAAGQESWGDYSSDKIHFPACLKNGACPVYYDGDTLLVSYKLGHSGRVERLVMSLVCMPMEDDDPPTRSLVLSDEALTGMFPIHIMVCSCQPSSANTSA